MNRLATAVLVACATNAFHLGAAQPRPARPPARSAGSSQAIFKSGTELVALNVTVTDSRQHYVAGLTATDFAVFEDGVKQDVSFFASNDIPIDLILLLDSSASMIDQMSVAREAVLGFLRTLRPGDRASFVAFNESLQVFQSLTEDRSQLEAAVAATEPSGATALYNALYVALREFGRSAKQVGTVRRQAIALVSDGEDTASMMPFENVLDQARRSGVSVYAVTPQSTVPVFPMPNRGRRYFSESAYAMKTLALETGGLAFFPTRIQELSAVYARIAAELGAQYSIAYTPKNTRRDGRFRRVVVQILSPPDARPRTRLGYFAETSGMAGR